MHIEKTLQATAAAAARQLFNAEIAETDINIGETRKEFEGDFTLISFPFVRFSKLSPEQTGALIGDYLMAQLPWIVRFNTVKGFLNLVIADSYWMEQLQRISHTPTYGEQPANGKNIVIEYVSPNTNKPLHFGHIRNMVLGYSVANLLQATGNTVHKVLVYNDRGINICNSMVAWQTLANGATPDSTHTKGDHFVGHYYVAFKQLCDEQAAELPADQTPPATLQAQEMLRKWEANDSSVRQLWQTMNNWVYSGFEQTYRQIGIDFDKYYYESQVYKRGKDIVLAGLQQGKFFQKEDGSVWVDLTDKGLDQKVLLRNDGTALYFTQDLALAEQRYAEFRADQFIYVVGNEQDYHFKVLFLVLEMLGVPYAGHLHHLSYGMVELPSGKMKSREGTAVDADDLMAEMIAMAKERTEEQGKTADLAPAEADQLYHTIGIGALKYFLLKVHAKNRIVFNPQESIDFVGHTGPFIQYTHARICAILRRYVAQYNTSIQNINFDITIPLHPAEREVIARIYQYEGIVLHAANALDPSLLANHIYFLAKAFNKLYAELPILTNPDADTNNRRAAIAAATAQVLQKGLQLLGIVAPERM